MKTARPTPQQLALDLAAAWNRLERTLDGSLSNLRGISFAEYRLLLALSRAPDARASRVDLAAAVGLTASGVTRALQPLGKLRIVKTLRDERDARLALASLTPAGQELVDDASAMVDDVMASLLKQTGQRGAGLAALVEWLAG